MNQISDISVGQLNHMVDTFLTPKAVGQMCLVSALDDELKNKMSNENYLKIWKNDIDVNQAKDLNINTQMVLLNKFFNKYLISCTVCSFEARKYLTIEPNPLTWVKTIKAVVIPFLIKNKIF